MRGEIRKIKIRNHSWKKKENEKEAKKKGGRKQERKRTPQQTDGEVTERQPQTRTQTDMEGVSGHSDRQTTNFSHTRSHSAIQTQS